MSSTRSIVALAVWAALVGSACGVPPAAAQEMKKQYWATSLGRTVDEALLRGFEHQFRYAR